MARSLLEKHKKPADQPASQKNKLQVIPGGRLAEARDHLKDEDWYYIHSFWNSSLFNRHYLRDDFQRKRTERLAEYEGEFEIFLNKLLNLCDSKRHEKFHTWNEDQIVKSWILPVMETLGWWDTVKDEVIPQLTFTVDDGETKKTYRPDLTFVPSQKLKGTIQEKSPGERLEYARRYGILTLEAKYWDRIKKYEKADGEIGAKDDLSKSCKGDSASSLAPGGQLLTYLKHLRNDDPVRNHFGIASDGKVWRLYHVDHPESQFFEFDLGDLYFEITSKENITDLTPKQYRCIEEAARYFFYVFSKFALYSETGEPTLVDELLKHRKDYVDGAEPNLKNRFLTAMRFACNGFDRAFKEAGIKADLETIRDVAESHIFNILFLKSCEANGIIRYEANTDVSITSIIERISYFDSTEGIDDESNERVNLIPKFRDFDFRNSGFDLHKKLLRLTEIVQNGGKLDGGFDICAFKETLLSDSEWSLLKKCHLTNIETVKLLYELGYMEEEGKYRQVPYNIFTPEQLGSIYESFLEFALLRAESDLEFIKKQWRPLSKDTADKIKRRENVRFPIARKGELFFTPDNSERKATGSYYTPDYIVKYIVENTLGPICNGKTADEILSVKVCDPAMGSGHFLTAALRYLTEKFLEKLGNEPQVRYRMPRQAKRDILDACIYGVDINPRAVRLAKMALWLETVYSGNKLERLSDQLKVGESLVGFKWESEFPDVFSKSDGFDAVIGNPPYVSTERMGNLKERLFAADFKVNEYQTDLYVFFVERFLSLARKTGRSGLIIPNSFLHYQTMFKLRKYLLEDCTIHKIVKTYDAFPEVTVDTVVVLASREKALQEASIEILDYSQAILKQVSSLTISGLGKEYIINLSPKLLADRCLDKMDAIPSKLGNHFTVKAGIKIRPEFITDSKQSRDSRPLLRGRDVLPFNAKWNGRQFVEYSKKAEAKYKNQALRDPKIFIEPKILIRQTADDIIGSVDYEGYVSMQSTYSIQAKKGFSGLLEYLCCLLNSNLIRNYFKTRFKKDKSTFPQIRAYDIEQLPYQPPTEDDISEAMGIYKIIERELRTGVALEKSQGFKKLNTFVERKYLGQVSKTKKVA